MTYGNSSYGVTPYGVGQATVVEVVAALIIACAVRFRAVWTIVRVRALAMAAQFRGVR